MEPAASIAEIEDAVNRVLALQRRTPQTVVAELGADFVKHHEHLATMLCEKHINVMRLMQMLRMARSVHTGERDQNEASEEIGMDLAMEYVDAVRATSGKRRKMV